MAKNITGKNDLQDFRDYLLLFALCFVLPGSLFAAMFVTSQRCPYDDFHLRDRQQVTNRKLVFLVIRTRVNSRKYLIYSCNICRSGSKWKLSRGLYGGSVTLRLSSHKELESKCAQKLCRMKKFYGQFSESHLVFFY